jgi:hypothetical protein
MQFSNINEAWGNDFISDNYQTNNRKTFKEHFKPLKNNNIQCSRIINHIKQCSHCKRQIFMNRQQPLFNLQNLNIQKYREPLLLILTTVFIIMLINLIVKMD